VAPSEQAADPELARGVDDGGAARPLQEREAGVAPGQPAGRDTGDEHDGPVGRESGGGVDHASRDRSVGHQHEILPHGRAAPEGDDLEPASLAVREGPERVSPAGQRIERVAAVLARRRRLTRKRRRLARHGARDPERPAVARERARVERPRHDARAGNRSPLGGQDPARELRGRRDDARRVLRPPLARSGADFRLDVGPDEVPDEEDPRAADDDEEREQAERGGAGRHDGSVPGTGRGYRVPTWGQERRWLVAQASFRDATAVELGTFSEDRLPCDRGAGNGRGSSEGGRIECR
jgi:hypothetical protein